MSNTQILVTKYFHIALTGKQIGATNAKGHADATAAVDKGVAAGPPRAATWQRPAPLER